MAKSAGRKWLFRLGRFLKLAFWPFAQAAINLLGLAGVTVGTVLLWVRDNGLVALVLLLAVAALALFVAGYRLQRKLDKAGERHWLRDALGRRLTLGRHLLGSITLAAGLAYAEEKVGDFPDPESDAAREGERTQKQIRDWEGGVEGLLRDHLDYSYAARFRNHAGLPRIDPPADWFPGGWTDQWNRVTHDLMRLEELIKETPRAVD